eukprot:GDKI01010508.1.p1 GENE.GDKI01010508.1~~GDKI01010508.1.p1  ORF type:complete len:167 (+),score=25.61 GDKI01010508.1:170-670(+)
MDLNEGDATSVSGDGNSVSPSPQHEPNRYFFRYERLQKVKPGCLFVNISRGEFAPLPGVLRALGEGILAGAALDVYNQEKHIAYNLRDRNRSKIFTPVGCVGEEARSEIEALGQIMTTPELRERVILTPHNSFNTEEAVDRKSEQTVRQISHWLETGRLLWHAPKW